MNFKIISRHKKIFEALLKEEGIYYEELSKIEISNLLELWKKKFKGKSLPKAETQIWKIFSADSFTNYVEGEDADKKYHNQPVKEFFIVAGDRGYQCIGKRLPNLERLKKLSRDFEITYDLYVSHKNLKWTYVYTHDDFCGPYFAE